MKRILIVILSFFTILFFAIGIIFGLVNAMKIENPLDKPVTIDNDDRIKLSEYISDYVITNGGEYKLTGTLKGHSIVIKAVDNENVTLNLENVIIEALDDYAIYNESEGMLTLNLLDDTVNSFTNGEKDIIIYSKGDLVITGPGKLHVKGTENKEKTGIKTLENLKIENGILNLENVTTGLDSKFITVEDGNVLIISNNKGIVSQNLILDNGKMFIYGVKSTLISDKYTINGGQAVFLSKEKNECASGESLQRVICFELDENAKSGTISSLMRSDNAEIISFQIKKAYKSVVISSEALLNGTYSFYQSGSHSGTLDKFVYSDGIYNPGWKLKIDDKESFEISGMITEI